MLKRKKFNNCSSCTHLLQTHYTIIFLLVLSNVSTNLSNTSYLLLGFLVILRCSLVAYSFLVVHPKLIYYCLCSTLLFYVFFQTKKKRASWQFLIKPHAYNPLAFHKWCQILQLGTTVTPFWPQKPRKKCTTVIGTLNLPNWLNYNTGSTNRNT